MRGVVIFLLVLLSVSLNAFEYMYSMSGAPCRWNSAAGGKLPISWRIHPDAPPVLALAMVSATQAWSGAAGGQLNFQQVDADTEGSILLVWDLECREPFPAFTSFVAFDGNIIAAAITINGNFRWRQFGGGVGSMDLHAVVLHELGHALGLGHASKENIVGAFRPEDLPTMYAAITRGAGTLHVDDILGIQSLYEIQAPLPEFSISVHSAAGKAPFAATFEQDGGDEQTCWAFGNGAESAGNSVRHRFTAAGIYIVSAESNGQIATTTIEVQSRRKPKRKAKP